MVSFVLPAHNEEAVLGETLRTLRESAEAVGEPFELIVVDDASIDRTAAIGRSLGATVVQVHLRQIAAARNAGARAARGNVLIFVDADTLVPVKTLRAAIAALRGGAVGGGARVQFDNDVPRWGHLLIGILTTAFCLLGLAGGCFLFARRDAFAAAGGFDEAFFASEEVHLSRALKAQGRFAIVPQAVTTSGRKLRLYSAWDFAKLFVRMAARGLNGLKSRDELGMWYESPREPSAMH